MDDYATISKQTVQFIDLKKEYNLTLLFKQPIRKYVCLTMNQSFKTYDVLKQNFLREMDFISNMGVHFFIYPFKGRSNLVMYCYYFTFGILCLTSAQLTVTLCLICINDFDWFEIINVAPNIGVCLMILIKYRKINNNKELYDQIVKHFRYDLWEAISDTADHMKILKQYTKTTRVILRFEFYYTIGITMIIDLFPRIIMIFQRDILGKEQQYLYPFDGWYPFDKIKWYNTAYVWESFMTTVVIFIYAFVNMLHFSLARYICMELKILGSTMEGLISNGDVVKNKQGREIEQTHHNVRNKLKFIICRHQFLAK